MTTAVPAAPPADREALLGAVESAKARIYARIRELLDELEAVAPWESLYDPPNRCGPLRALVAALVELAERIPARVEERLAELRRQAGEGGRASLEDAEFFYSGIHRMVANDLRRLRERSSALDARPADEPVAADERNRLAETAADLKGKYASALMGATASIVAEGRWDGVAVEPILFPEKREEFARNQRLLAALEEVAASLRALGEAIAFPYLLERWEEHRRADRYALADLAVLRGRLGVLLKQENRRALYSGDYHHVQHLEERLADRHHELETLHRRTWLLAAADDGYGAELFTRLRRVLLEVAALVDAGLLEEVYGERAVYALRASVGLTEPAAGVPAELAPLAPLLAEEDLATFLELLLGAVAKRASFGERRERARPKELEDTTSGWRLSTGVPLLDVEELGEQVAPTPAPIRPNVPAPALDVAPAERRAALEALHDELGRLRSPRNPHWRGVKMLQRLLRKHTRVPPSMVEAVHPFLFDAMNNLVPRIQAVADLGLLPADTGEKLVRHCLHVCESRPDPDEMDADVPRRLQRVDRLLDALQSAVAAQLR